MFGSDQMYWPRKFLPESADKYGYARFNTGLPELEVTWEGR